MGTPTRLVGLDVARALALLGMVATHLLAPRTPAGDLTWHQALAGGRASALFAVLAGVTLALASGGGNPVRGRERLAVSGGLAARAVLVALLGLALGALDTPVAIILTYYGALFLLGLAFVGSATRTLVVLAAGWVVAAPVASQLVRGWLVDDRGPNPAFGSLADPGQLLQELLLTGAYPALVWLAYLLSGMAVGRCDLSDRRVQTGLLAGGAGLAFAATEISGWWAHRHFDALTLAWARGGLSGTTPAGDRWDWLLLAAPHSGTPFDLARTIGSSLVVIGGCLLVVGLLQGESRRSVSILFGAGTMTLTLYSLHVALTSRAVWPPEESWAMTWHVLLLGLVGAGFAAAGRRGPLEVLVGAPGRWLIRKNTDRPVVRSS